MSKHNKKISKLREKNKYTFMKLSELLNTNVNTLLARENKVPTEALSLATLIEYAELYKVPIYELLDDENLAKRVKANVKLGVNKNENKL